MEYIQSLCESIESAANELEKSSKQLMIARQKLIDKKDLDYAIQAISEIQNVTQLCRPDLIAIRALRAMKNKVD